MTVSVTYQAYIFLMSALCGGIIGIVFDIFRAARKIKKPSQLRVHIEDIAFWIIAFLIVAAFLFFYASGEVNFFEFFGILLGLTIYFLLFSKFVIKMMIFAYEFLKKMVVFVVKIALIPIALVYKVLKKPISCLSKKAAKAKSKGRAKFKNALGRVKTNFKNIKKRLKKL